MNAILIEVMVILLLFIANGVFAMTELAVVSARKLRLKQLAQGGSAGARAALELAESPGRFLPTVQIGITLVGLLAGAFGGATIAEKIAERLEPLPTFAPYAEAIGVGIVVLALTFVSLVIGELFPKRLALAYPERIACLLAPPMDWLSRLTRPGIRLLSAATDFCLWVFRVRPRPVETVTEDEVKFMVQEGVNAGVFDREEPRMVESVLAFDRRPVGDIMTPRAKIIFLKQDESHAEVWHKIVVSHHSNFPVYAGARDNVVGVVSVKSIYANLAAGVNVKLGDLMTAPLLVKHSETIKAVLEQFKATGHHVALVSGTDGKIAGLVTLVDVLEAIVGAIPSLEERLKPAARRRDDGTWLVDGALGLAEFATMLGTMTFPTAVEGVPRTVGDFALSQLGANPHEGDTFRWQGWLFEVADMDGERIDKLLLLPEGFQSSRQT
jgi:putative hemolysin